MSEEIKGETPEEEPTEKPEEVKPEEETQEEFDKDRAMATIKNLREIEKQAKKDAKKLADLEKAEQERKEAEMSELEKANTKLAELEAKNAELARKQMQREAAEKIGLPSVFADRVQGETPEDMEADAKKLLDAMPEPKKVTKVPPSGKETEGGKETDEERRRRLGI